MFSFFLLVNERKSELIPIKVKSFFFVTTVCPQQQQQEKGAQEQVFSTRFAVHIEKDSYVTHVKESFIKDAIIKFCSKIEH
jgi:hypothetical protein